ncbi:hypothetical protein P8452_18147 [Trifolium repens]|nr:hypothetical protein QL285_058629 [Trifolium repens]WJX29512.1 hypothetical protein P8452_18147 [Trifolium repens]
MSQQSSKNNNPDDSKTQTEEASSQMPRVSDFRVDQQGTITNAVPINMIPPTEDEIKKKKSKGSKKKKNPKKTKTHATGNDKIQEQESTNPECQPSENQETQKISEVPHVKPFDETSTKEHQVKVAEQISPPANEVPSSETATNISSRPQEDDHNLDQPTPSVEVPAQDVEPNVPTSGSAATHEQEVQDLGQEDQEDVDEVPLANILQEIKRSGKPQQSMEEESSEESEGIRISIPINRRAKTYKSKQVETQATAKKGKRKTEVVGEKRSKKKKQAVTVSESESDGEPDVLDITTAGKKRIGGRRIPANIPPAPMDRVSFHSEESAQKWRFVYQRRIAQERELNQEALECKEIIKLLEAAELMKTMKNLGNCYEMLVKEFIVNITSACSEGSGEFGKVRVRGKDVKFSPTTINEYLGRNPTIEGDEAELVKEVTKEITGGQVSEWPKKGLLSTGCLSVKYAILNRIGAANWAPTNHGSGITPMLAKMIFLIGTKKKLNFGDHVFNQTMKHAETYAVKLPIAFPCLITGMILRQYPNILYPDEAPTKKPQVLSFDYKLFVGTHVPDIVFPKMKETAEASGSMPRTNKEDVLAELMQISKTLEQTIKTSTARKTHVDNLIKSIMEEGEGEEEVGAAQAEAEQQEEEV